MHATHFKILSFLRHDDFLLNVPHFMYCIMLKRATVVQKGTPKDVSHHYFIKLIIEKALREQFGIPWDDFVKTKVQNLVRQHDKKIEKEREH